MPDQRIFCNSPWYELHVYWDGSLGFCCHATPAVPYPDTARAKYNLKNMSIAEWYRSKPMQQARQRMFDTHRWDHCNRCWHEEQVGTTSRRHRSNQKSVIFRENFRDSFEQSPGYQKFTDPEFAGLPIDLHIDLGNYCNLACKMCNPLASSRIASQHRTWQLIDSVPQDWTQDEAVWQRFVNEVAEIPGLKNLHFMGGETLIQPRFEQFIDFLIKHGRTDICISFVTNGTVYNDALVQKLKLFARVGIEVSIETLTETNAYIRQGTDTDQVLANIGRYQSESNGNSVTVTLRPAPNLFSARDYWQVIQLALDQQLIIKSNICTDPGFLSVEALPRSIRQGYVANYQQLLKDYELTDMATDYNESDPHNYRLVARNQIVQMIAMLDAPDPDNQKVLITQLCQHIQAWDQVYHYDATQLYPEMAKLLTEYGYAV